MRSATKRLIIACVASSFLAGCTGLYDKQPPTPVYGRNTIAQDRLNKHQKAITHPINEPKEIQENLWPPIMSTVPLAAPKENASKTSPRAIEAATGESGAMSSGVATESVSGKEHEAINAALSPQPLEEIFLGDEEQPPSNLETTKHDTQTQALKNKPEQQASEAEMPEKTSHTDPLAKAESPEQASRSFQPIEMLAPMSPAISALLAAANQSQNNGNLSLTGDYIERAIRIEPRNASLFYKLAVLRFQQEKPELAEELAMKSALLSTKNNKLKRHCWLLVAHSREMQQNFVGAKEAEKISKNY